MTDPARRPPGQESPYPFDPDELSRVRTRAEAARSLRAPSGLSLEQKLARAEVLAASLPLTDGRRRLIGIALLRRDEALLDGLLASAEK